MFRCIIKRASISCSLKWFRIEVFASLGRNLVQNPLFSLHLALLLCLIAFKIKALLLFLNIRERLSCLVKKLNVLDIVVGLWSLNFLLGGITLSLPKLKDVDQALVDFVTATDHRTDKLQGAVSQLIQLLILARNFHVC